MGLGNALAHGLDAVGLRVHKEKGDVVTARVFAVKITAGRRAEGNAGEVFLRLKLHFFGALSRAAEKAK